MGKFTKDTSPTDRDYLAAVRAVMTPSHSYLAWAGTSNPETKAWYLITAPPLSQPTLLQQMSIALVSKSCI